MNQVTTSVHRYASYANDVMLVRITKRIYILKQFDFIQRLIKEILVVLDYLEYQNRKVSDETGRSVIQ